MTSSSQILTFSTLILGEGPLVIPCAETLLRHKHTIQAIVSTNDVIQDWAQEQKIPWVARQDDLLSAVVRVKSKILANARSAATLGVAREGSGILIREGLVLTIGYLVIEAESIEVANTEGRTVPAT